MSISAAPRLPALFIERQSFWRPWWWLALVIPVVVGGIVLLRLRQMEQVSVSAQWFILLPLLPGLLMGVLLAVLRLDTYFDEEGVCYRMVPLRWRRIAWTEVRRAYVREYSPLSEYGGWGIKGFSTTNYAYNVAGNQGLQLELRNGHRILLGTKQPEAIRQLLLQLEISETPV